MIEAACQNALLSAGVRRGRLLVGVSGGRDSVTLLSLLTDVAPEFDIELIVGHVNHQLRGDASFRDEDFVRSLAGSWGLAFSAQRVDPEAQRSDGPSRTRPTLEEAARELRRDALLQMSRASGATWIAAAHHAGDQAETVLLRILRGTGPTGLAAMATLSTDGLWLRPLLGVTPDLIESYARNKGLDWVEDESNQDVSFARNRLRLEEIPRLAESFNPQLLRALCNLAEAQRTDLEWIEDLVTDAARERIEIREGSMVQLCFDEWNEIPEALGRRLVRRALLAVGLDRDLTRRHIDRVLDFVRRGRSVGRNKILELPCGITLKRGEAGFELGPIPAEQGIDRSDNAKVLERH